MQGNFTNLKLPKRSRFPAVLAAACHPQKHPALSSCHGTIWPARFGVRGSVPRVLLFHHDKHASADKEKTSFYSFRNSDANLTALWSRQQSFFVING